MCRAVGLPVVCSLLLLLAISRTVAGAPSPSACGSARQSSAGGERATIRGTVLDARTRTPLSRVHVHVRNSDRESTTDRDGRFLLTDVPPGRGVLQASAVGYALASHDIDLAPGQTVDLTILLVGGAGTYTETVDVVAPPGDVISITPTRQYLEGVELQRLSGGVAEDPMRAVQALPGVATGDDLRAEFTVRGGGPRQIGISYEGVTTSLLVHTWHLGDDGSVSMINGAAVDRMALSRGVYPQRGEGRLGAWLDVTMREGPRDRTEAVASTSLTMSSFSFGGPIGTERRGSYLVAGRYNYIDKLLGALGSVESSAFSMLDSQGKIVYDLTRRHQLQTAWVVGRAGLDMEEERQEADPEDDYLTTNTTGLLTAAVRSTLAQGLVVTHRLAIVGNHYETNGFFLQNLQRSTSSELSYRGDLTLSFPRQSLLEVGVNATRRARTFSSADYWWADARRVAIVRTAEDGFDQAAWQTGAHAVLVWHQGPHLTVSPGIRLERSALTRQTVGSPWLQAIWTPARRWEISAAASVNHQFPDLHHVAGAAGGGRSLRAERAVHAELAFAHAVSPHTRVQMTAYNRSERDGLRLEDGEIRLTPEGVFWPGQAPMRYANALGARARGIEIEIRAGHPNGLSGWISYALGSTRVRDVLRGEEYWGDYDQRHTLNAFAQYRLTPRLSLSGRVRIGSNYPLAGYYERRSTPIYDERTYLFTDEQYLVSSTRNTERLPTYARVDLRMDRTFTVSGRRVALFVEVTNLLGRDNQRQDLGGYWRHPDGTVHYNWPFKEMFPTLPMVGLSIDLR